MVIVSHDEEDELLGDIIISSIGTGYSTGDVEKPIGEMSFTKENLFE